LWNWQLPPGYLEDGTFSGLALRNWLEQVEELTRASGHWEVALDQVGRVLKWSPPDPDGLWIHRDAAAVLNRKEGKILRQAFHCEYINSRGAHFVDPSGQPERDLAAHYQKQADEVENAGFVRLAATMGDLAESYSREADRIASGRDF
jgi:hypothetical protein